MSDATPTGALPRPGLGTSGNEGETCADAVETALDLGYRHVDTAQGYGNEESVGEGLRRADVERESVFLATKVHPGNLASQDVLASTRDSLDRLGVDYVDLLYVHWPRDAYDAADTLPAFDRLREDGAIRHVGVSNFTPDLLDEARRVLDAPIFAHQVEMHPLLQQRELLAYAERHDHRLVAYSPVLKGGADEEDALHEVAEKHDATPAQVCLAWLMDEERVVPIPKATGETHLRENLAARDLSLDDEDRDRIAALDGGDRLIDPDGAPWN